MSLTNKLFSLLGFAEPVTLKRFNGANLLPEEVLLLSINKHVNTDIEQTLAQLNIKLVQQYEDIEAKTIAALVIDATSYIDENSYQNLYLTVQKTLKLLSHNARILFVTKTLSPKQRVEENTYYQAIIGFSKSLAKEVGRKGSTANIVLFKNKASASSSNCSASLSAPFEFFLSSKSAFVSGQVLAVNKQVELSIKTSKISDKRKTAVVTGAAQGIGAAIASKLAAEGYLVIGVDIEPMQTQLTNIMESLHGKSFILDVSAKDAGQQLAKLANEHDGFDLIVHNAGVTRDKTLAKMPEHFWQQTININLLSVIRINETLIKGKSINDGGSIVCLSSMNGIAGQGGQTNYACSKAGIIGYVKSMSYELAENNININAVAPGFIETKMTEKIPFFTREMGRRMSALGQGGLPIDVAETVAFLGCESSKAISGQTLRVCGLNIIGA
jgi:3-oxoacyl-[acyl-carrier protein] reductase